MGDARRAIGLFARSIYRALRANACPKPERLYRQIAEREQTAYCQQAGEIAVELRESQPRQRRRQRGEILSAPGDTGGDARRDGRSRAAFT
jgi:hypothetical protein